MALGSAPMPVLPGKKAMPALPVGVEEEDEEEEEEEAVPSPKVTPPLPVKAAASTLPLPVKAAAPMPALPGADKQKPALPGKTAPRPRADTGAGIALRSKPMPVLPGKWGMPAQPTGVEEEDEEDEEEEEAAPSSKPTTLPLPVKAAAPMPALPGRAAAPMPALPGGDKKPALPGKPALLGKPALPAKTAPRPRADTGAGMALGSAPMPVLPGKKAMPALPVGVEEEDEEDEEEEDEEAHMRGETYEVVQTVALCEGSSIDSKKVGNLKTGETVTALKVEMVDGHTRVQIKRKKKKKKVWASAV